MGKRVVHGNQLHAAFPDQFPDLCQRIGALFMKFLKAVKTAVFFIPDKQRQIVLIDLFLFIKIIFPDKAGFLPVLRNGRLTHIPILLRGVKIKNEHPAGIQIIIYQAKYL